MHQRLTGYANVSALPPNKLDCLHALHHLSYEEEAITVTSVEIGVYICVLRTVQSLLAPAQLQRVMFHC